MTYYSAQDSMPEANIRTAVERALKTDASKKLMGNRDVTPKPTDTQVAEYNRIRRDFEQQRKDAHLSSSFGILKFGEENR